jgi:F420-dependent oxidoreductase-like protein
VSEPSAIRLPADALVVLAGPSGSGKSTWAARWFESNQVVSTDQLRGVVGEHEHDLRASADAFAVVDMIVERRMKRGLVTVVDSLGMDPEQNKRWLTIANSQGRSTHLVLFDEDPKICRKQNKGRPGEVPSKVLTAQLQKWAECKGDLGQGFDLSHNRSPASVVATNLLSSGPADGPPNLKFGLTVSSFEWDTDVADRLGRIAADAESAGMASIWVMDHFMQIPQVGREWDRMLEAYSTLGFLAARTSRVTLGTLVSCITHRNIGLLGKTVASLDVLSGGRAVCGLGIGWFEREHRAYGYEFPPVGRRYQLLEDALEFLPLLWGPGSPAFEGQHFSTPEALCYPRPIQDPIPVLIGGSGEKKTLRLVAKYADACNIFGEPETVRKKIDVLNRHCDELGRDPREIQITQLSSVIAAERQTELTKLVETLKATNESASSFTNRATAGTHEQHIDRFGRLAEVGVQQVIVSLGDMGRPDAVSEFAPIIETFAR